MTRNLPWLVLLLAGPDAVACTSQGPSSQKPVQKMATSITGWRRLDARLCQDVRARSSTDLDLPSAQAVAVLRVTPPPFLSSQTEAECSEVVRLPRPSLTSDP